MDAIKAWFDAYSVQIRAIIDAIYKFVLGIFSAETEGEFDKIKDEIEFE